MDSAQAPLSDYMAPASNPMKKWVIVVALVVVILLGANLLVMFVLPAKKQPSVVVVPTPTVTVLQPTSPPTVTRVPTLFISPTRNPSPSVTGSIDVQINSFLTANIAPWQIALAKADNASRAWSTDSLLYQVEIHTHPISSDYVNWVYWYYSPGKNQTKTIAVIGSDVREEPAQSTQPMKQYETFDRSATYFSPAKTLEKFLSKVPVVKLKNMNELVLHLNHFTDHPVSGESGKYVGWIISILRTTSSAPEQAEIEISSGQMAGM